MEIGWNTRRGIVLAAAVLLLIFGRWKILILLIAIAYFFTLPPSLPESDGVRKDLGEFIALLPLKDQPYFLKRWDALQKLEGIYPKEKIKRAKMKMVNEIVYLLPIRDEEEVVKLKERIALSS